MIRDAKKNAAEDRKFQELINQRNQADTLIHSARTSIESLGDSVNPDDRNTINNLIAELEIHTKGKDTDKIRTKMQEIEGALNGIISQHQAAGASQAQPDDEDTASAGTDPAGDEDVVDADFEEET